MPFPVKCAQDAHITYWISYFNSYVCVRVASKSRHVFTCTQTQIHTRIGKYTCTQAQIHAQACITLLLWYRAHSLLEMC